MSVYNGERFLGKSIDSVLGQTFSDFEFIIVDDCSNDATPQILSEYVKRDQRIRTIRNNRNLGLTHSLNKGLLECRGEYIARQDADDISDPKRFKNQVQYLTEHPDVGVLGSWVAIIDEKGKVSTTRKLPTSPALIKWTLFFGNPLAHSSVMMRRSLIENNTYKPEILYSQDYDLWARLSEKTRLANIPLVLSLSRKHEQMISIQHRDSQRQMGDIVRRHLIENLLGGMVPDYSYLTFRKVNQKQILETENEVQEVITFIKMIHRGYIAQQDDLYSTEKDEISMDVARRIVNIGLMHSEKYPLLTLKTLLQGLLKNCRVLRPSDIKILLRNIIRYIRTETERVTNEMPSASYVGTQRPYVNAKI